MLTKETQEQPVPEVREGQTKIEKECEHCEHHGHRSWLDKYGLMTSVLVGALLISLSITFAGGGLTIGKEATPTGNTGNQVLGQQTPPAGPVDIQLKPDVPYIGSADAKVTIVEFADYQCPFCEQWHKTLWPELKAKYVDTGKVKFVYQDFSFLGPDSNTASEAAHCAADQGKFWEYHQYLFDHQGTENGGWASAAHQKEFAQALGLDTKKFNQCLDTGKFKQAVADETSAGRSYGVTGTPTVFINGKMLVGVQPVQNFVSAIEEALKE